MPRVDDRRVVSGIVYMIKHGLQWKDAPKGLSGILCARPVSSPTDEPFAEDDGELDLGLEPLAGRSFPFLGRVVQDQI